MQHIGHLILLFALSLSAFGQDLGELEYEEMPSSGIIVDDPSASLLVIESTVKGSSGSPARMPIQAMYFCSWTLSIPTSR